MFIDEKKFFKSEYERLFLLLLLLPTGIFLNKNEDEIYQRFFFKKREREKEREKGYFINNDKVGCD